MTHPAELAGKRGPDCSGPWMASVFDEQESGVDVGSLAGKGSGGQVFVPSS
jgi:hypothetical protein